MGIKPVMRHSKLRRCMASLIAGVTAFTSGICSDIPFIGAKAAYASEPTIVDSANAVNYSSILGRAVDYGILAKDFSQLSHMETTYAVYKYNSNTNNDVDLSEGGTAQFIVGELSEGSHLVFGKVGENTKTFNIEAPKEIFEGFDVNNPNQSGKSGTYITTHGNFTATIYPKYTEKEVIKSNIDRMIEHIKDGSEELNAKATNSAYKIDLSSVMRVPSSEEKAEHGWNDCSCLLDLSDSKYKNKVVYVNVNDSSTLRGKISESNQLFIYKPSSTVVIMNVNDTNSLTIKKYSVSVVDGETFHSETTHSGNISVHNKAVNKDMAQKIIWNIPNATDVTIDTSAGTFIVPNENARVHVGSSAGWLATGGYAENNLGEWHYIYEGTSEDTNSDMQGQIHFAARKSFTDDFALSSVGANGFFKPTEDKTVDSEGGSYKFHFYRTNENFDTNNYIEDIPKYLANGNTDIIVNEDTNKIKFPVLSFYTDDSLIPEGRKGAYAVKDNTSQTYYFVIKEDASGTVKNGIRNSDGEVDIKLVVKNDDGEFSYTISYVTYLNAAKTKYKEYKNVAMSGIEFSLGAFFNYNVNTVKILKTDQFGKFVVGANLRLEASNGNGNPVSMKNAVVSGGNLMMSQSSAENGYIVFQTIGGPVYLNDLSDGYYTLKEIRTPTGYEKAPDIANIEIKNGRIVKTETFDGEGKTDSSTNTIQMIDVSHIELTKVDQFGEEVVGATLTLENKNGGLKNLEVKLGDEAKLISKDNTKITWLSGESSTFVLNLPDGTYTLTEENCPKGYLEAESITFTVTNGVITSSDNDDAISGNQVIMVDAAEIEICKLDQFGSEVSGAKLTLTGNGGSNWEKFNKDFGEATVRLPEGSNYYDTSKYYHDNWRISWTSGGESIYIGGLPDGDYKLTEEKAPQGYSKADQISFTIKNGAVTTTGNGLSQNKVVMTDKATDGYVAINKVDQFGKEVKGATLTLKSSDNADISSAQLALGSGASRVVTGSKSSIAWISGTSETSVKDLPDGNYSLVESNYPAGYKEAAQIDFELIGGKVYRGGSPVADNKIEMVDIADLEICKTDQFGLEVSGATLVLSSLSGVNMSDSNIKVTAGNGAYLISQKSDYLSWKSGTTSTYIRNLPNGTYVLTETDYPTGYKLAEAITFNVTDNKIYMGGVAQSSNKIQMIDIADIELRLVDESGNKLSGGTLSLIGGSDSITEDTNFGDTDVDLKNGPGTSTATWVTDTSSVYTNNLKDGDYILKEDYPPTGYKKEDSIYFTVKDGKITTKSGSISGNSVIMVNKTYKAETGNQTTTVSPSSNESTTAKEQITQSTTTKDTISNESTTSKNTITQTTTKDNTSNEATTAKEIKTEVTTKDTSSSESSTKNDASPGKSPTKNDTLPSEATTTKDTLPNEATTTKDTLPSEATTAKDTSSGESATKQGTSPLETTTKDISSENTTESATKKNTSAGDDTTKKDSSSEATTKNNNSSSGGGAGADVPKDNTSSDSSIQVTTIDTAKDDNSQQTTKDNADVKTSDDMNTEITTADTKGNTVPKGNEAETTEPSSENSKSATDADTAETTAAQNNAEKETSKNGGNGGSTSGDPASKGDTQNEAATSKDPSSETTTSNGDSENNALTPWETTTSVDSSSEETTSQDETLENSESATETTTAAVETVTSAAPTSSSRGGGGSSSRKASIKGSTDKSKSDGESKEDSSNSKEDSSDSHKVDEIESSTGDGAAGESLGDTTASVEEESSINDSSDNITSSSDNTSYENSDDHVPSSSSSYEYNPDDYTFNEKSESQDSFSDDSKNINGNEAETERGYYSSVSANDASEATGGISNSSGTVEKTSSNVTVVSSGQPEGYSVTNQMGKSDTSADGGASATKSSSGSLPKTGSPVNTLVLLGLGALLMTVGVLLLKKKTNK